MRHKEAFINRFILVDDNDTSLADFLRNEYIISDEEYNTYTKGRLNRSDKISKILEWLRDPKLQMVDMQWKVLPKEEYALVVIAAHNQWEISSAL